MLERCTRKGTILSQECLKTSERERERERERGRRVGVCLCACECVGGGDMVYGCGCEGGQDENSDHTCASYILLMIFENQLRPGKV